MNVDTIGNIVALILFLVFGATVINNAICSRQLARYLEKNYSERWSYLTSVGNIDFGFWSSLRSMPYVYGEEDNEDPEIVRLKDIVKSSTTYMISVIVAAPVTMILFGIICEAIRVLRN